MQAKNFVLPITSVFSTMLGPKYEPGKQCKVFVLRKALARNVLTNGCSQTTFGFGRKSSTTVTATSTDSTSEVIPSSFKGAFNCSSDAYGHASACFHPTLAEVTVH